MDRWGAEGSSARYHPTSTSPVGDVLGGCPAGMAAGEPDAVTRVARLRLLASVTGMDRTVAFGERLGEDTGARGLHRAPTVPGSLSGRPRPAWSRHRPRVVDLHHRADAADAGGGGPDTACTVAALQCQATAHILEASSRPIARQYAAASPGKTGSRVLGGTPWQHVARGMPVPCRTTREARMYPWNALGTSCHAPNYGAGMRPTAEYRMAKPVGTENG